MRCNENGSLLSNKTKRSPEETQPEDYSSLGRLGARRSFQPSAACVSVLGAMERVPGQRPGSKPCGRKIINTISINPNASIR